MTRPFAYSHRFTGKSEPTSHDDLHGIRLALEKRIAPEQWIRTGSAANLQAAQRHAEAIGGEVRAKRVRSEEVLAVWVEGVLVGP